MGDGQLEVVDKGKASSNCSFSLKIVIPGGIRSHFSVHQCKRICSMRLKNS